VIWTQALWLIVGIILGVALSMYLHDLMKDRE
jgi:hypothetical protein